MDLLARSTDYAIRALLYMEKDSDGVISTTELEENLGLPRPFMRKILQVLQKEGYLISIKGHKGGFRLAKKPQDILLIDLMTIFQGKVSLAECLFKKKVCSCVSNCPLRREVKSIEKDVVARLKEVSLASLLS